MTELLDDMALFVEVAKAMSFRRAAEITGVPNATVSRRISRLEKALGLRLLRRTTRRVELTEAGRWYFERCEPIVEDARLAHRMLGDMLAQPVGILRASLPVDFANIVLLPAIDAFARRYPGIRFEFDLTPRQVDLVSEPFDVAIRMGEPLASSGLIGWLLATLPRGLYAAPTYLQRAGAPDTPEALAGHDCLSFPSGRPRHWSLQSAGRACVVAIDGRFRANNMGMVQRLAMCGQGIALLADILVEEDLAAGRLVRVLPAWRASPVSAYALTESRLLPAKTRCFIEFLRQALKA